MFEDISRARTISSADEMSRRSGRRHKDFHPSRDARLGTPACGEAQRKPRARSEEDSSAREGGRRHKRFWITSNMNEIVATIARFRGLGIYFTRFPGACAPGFMLT